MIIIGALAIGLIVGIIVGTWVMGICIAGKDGK